MYKTSVGWISNLDLTTAELESIRPNTPRLSRTDHARLVALLGTLESDAQLKEVLDQRHVYDEATQPSSRRCTSRTESRAARVRPTRWSTIPAAARPSSARAAATRCARTVKATLAAAAARAGTGKVRAT